MPREPLTAGADGGELGGASCPDSAATLGADHRPPDWLPSGACTATLKPLQYPVELPAAHRGGRDRDDHQELDGEVGRVEPTHGHGIGSGRAGGAGKTSAPAGGPMRPLASLNR